MFVHRTTSNVTSDLDVQQSRGGRNDLCGWRV